MVTYVVVGMFGAPRPVPSPWWGASGRAGNPFSRPLADLVRFGYAGAAHPVNR
ncbi:MAG: hypothetical protein JWM67_963 [Mycobacterium sp.]|jgi:hypothetical protein|nr:hypothetical protein [Mycobacterium sp.]